MCICICVCVCVYIYIHTCMHVCMYACMYVYIHALSVSLSPCLLKSVGTSDPSGKNESDAFLASHDNWHVNITDFSLKHPSQGWKRSQGVLRPSGPRCQEFTLWSCVCVQNTASTEVAFQMLGETLERRKAIVRITSFYNSSRSLTSRLQEETCKWGNLDCLCDVY